MQPWSPTQQAALGEVTALDAYVESSTVHVLVASKAAGQQRILTYLNTSNGGKTWSTAVRIPADQPPTISRRGNDVQLVAHGKRLLALWQAQGEYPGSGPIVSAYSHDKGRTWHNGPLPADSQGTDQSHLDAVTDSSGRIHLVWLDDREEAGNYQGLRYARSDDGGLHWGHYATLDTTTCTCCWTSLAVDRQDRLYALYRDGEPHDMVLMASPNGGESWEARGKVGAFNWTFQGCPHAGGGLAATGDDRLHSLVWTGKDGVEGLYFMRTEDHGKSWSAYRLPDRNAAHADLAAMDSRQLLSIWDSKSATGSEIFVAKSCDGGRSWSSPFRLSKQGVEASHPRLVATENGFLPLWTERRNKGGLQIGSWPSTVIAR